MHLLTWLRSPASEPPSSEEVRAQLGAILATRRFRRSVGQSELLRYLVERALEGEAGALEEPAIARAVFGRGEAFDPQTDKVVRLVAQRVRKNLDRYYSRRDNDAVRIKLPRGSYAPVFSAQSSRDARRRAAWIRAAAALAVLVAAAGLFWLGGGAWLKWRVDHTPRRTYRSVAVLPLVNSTGVRRLDPFMDLLGNELAVRLGVFPGMKVVPRPAVARFAGASWNPRRIARELSVEALLRGQAQVHDRSLRVTLELVDGGDGRSLWLQVYDVPEPDLLAMVDSIGYAVATAMGETGR